MYLGNSGVCGKQKRHLTSFPDLEPLLFSKASIVVSVEPLKLFLLPSFSLICLNGASSSVGAWEPPCGMLDGLRTGGREICLNGALEKTFSHLRRGLHCALSRLPCGKILVAGSRRFS